MTLGQNSAAKLSPAAGAQQWAFSRWQNGIHQGRKPQQENLGWRSGGVNNPRVTITHGQFGEQR